MITVYWLDDLQTCIRLDYFHPIESWEEYRLAVDKAFKMAAQKSYPVAIIHNANVTPMPSGNALEHLRYMRRNLPKNVHTSVGVVNHRVARRIVHTLNNIMQAQHKYHIVETLAEAEALLDSLSADQTSSAAG